MSSQIDYRSCMATALKGLRGLSKEDRKLEFCVSAKRCSKDMPREEAVQICSQPKPPKEAKTRSKKNCADDMAQVAQCLVGTTITPTTTVEEIHTSLVQCYCGKAPSKKVTAAQVMSLEQQQAQEVVAELMREYGEH